MSIIRDKIQGSSRIQRFFALILGFNILLILWGIHIVPAILSLAGIASTLAIIGFQLLITLLAFFGPLSFQHYRSIMRITFLFGVLFAAVYEGILLSDFVPGINLDINIWLLFVGVSGLAGFSVGYQTRRVSQGVIAAGWALVIGTAIWGISLLLMTYASWGTPAWYNFWLKDGAIDDFQRSGSANLNLFLLQDLQGALFFHQLLSVSLGAICGLVASSLAQGVLLLRKKIFKETAS